MTFSRSRAPLAGTSSVVYSRRRAENVAVHPKILVAGTCNMLTHLVVRNVIRCAAFLYAILRNTHVRCSELAR